MPNAFSIEISGLGEALALLNNAPQRVKDKVAQAVYISAEHVMTRSKEEFVPVVTGSLRASGHVEAPTINGSDINVKMGFGGPSAPYALSVHENPRSGITHGYSPSGHSYGNRYSQIGQWKYLEAPLLQSVNEIRERILAAVIEGFNQ